MKLVHHDLEFELDDNWWSEAGMDAFIPSSHYYNVDISQNRGEEWFEVAINDVEPVRRNAGVGIFNDNEYATAQKRVVSILIGFCSGAMIPPVEVIEQSKDPYRYKLVVGVHRFYCSLAAGFTHVPAIKGFDWSTIRQ